MKNSQNSRRSYVWFAMQGGIAKLTSMVMLLLGFASPAWCGVIVFDRVAPAGEAVYLKIQTKGRFLAEGGILVDIFVDDKKQKRILTGGDGYGYLKYQPERRGLIRLEARSNIDVGRGFLLVVDNKDPIILIETESTFKDSLFSEKILATSRKAVESLSQKYTIIYLSRYFGVDLTRNWLAKERFPQAIVLKWQGPELLKSLKSKGLNLHALIGSASLASAAVKYIEKRYTFEETKDGQTVKSWEEITESLTKNKPAAQTEF
jgi:hypothetical protein